MKNLLLAIFTFLFFACAPWESPYVPDSSKYVYPFFKVDSTTTTFSSNDTVIDTIQQMVLIGNDIKSQFRWRLDSLLWSDWVEKGTKPFLIIIDSLDTGWHTLDVQTCYNPKAHVADSTFTFFRASCPAITKLLLNQKQIVGVPFEIRHDSTCTLLVSGIGTSPLFYKWYKDSICIDSTGSTTIVLSNFGSIDLFVGNKY